MSERTVKVRVAVAVDPEGDWDASGWSQGAANGARGKANGEPAADADVVETVADHVREGERIYWLTAELPIPTKAEPVEVAATVEPTP